MQSQLPNFIVYEFSCKCVYICGTISCISKEHQKRLYRTLQHTLHMCHWKIWHEAFGECLVQPIKRSADRDKSCTELGLQHKPIILITSVQDRYPLLGRYRSLISMTLEALILIFILFGWIWIKKVTTLLRLNRKSFRLFCDHIRPICHTLFQTVVICYVHYWQ